MIQHTSSTAIAPELEAEFQAAVRQAMSSRRDPEAMRRAAERMDRMREETFREHGLLDFGVPAIRELRGDLPEWILIPSMPLLLRAAEIPSASRVGVYDCLYVALAERERRELVTADSRHLANLKPTLPFIIDLASLPWWSPLLAPEMSIGREFA
jgi:hypothetical protein